MIIAGVVMNFLLAAFILGLGHGLGLPSPAGENYFSHAKVGQTQIQILEIAPDSPAKQNGILAGDIIKSMQATCACSCQNKIVIPVSVTQVQDFIGQHKGQEIVLSVQRGQQTLAIKTIPRVDPPVGQGALGVALSETVIVSYPWYLALFKGFQTAANLTVAIVVAIAGLLWQLVSGAGSQAAAGVTGPIGIYTLTGQMANLGFVYVLQFIALLSLNLTIVNLLPFPALDGGRLLFLLIEKIKGKPVNQRVERLVHTIGFVILIILMLAVTFRDIARWF